MVFFGLCLTPTEAKVTLFSARGNFDGKSQSRSTGLVSTVGGNLAPIAFTGVASAAISARDYSILAVLQADGAESHD
jgi:hypothetical protein